MVFTDDENYLEWMHTGWTKGNADSYDLNIHQAMVRQQIENISFIYKNVTKLSESRITELSDFTTLSNLKFNLDQRKHFNLISQKVTKP